MQKINQPQEGNTEKLDLNTIKKSKASVTENIQQDDFSLLDLEETKIADGVQPPVFKSFLLFAADILINAAIIIAIVFTIRYFIVSPFQVSGTSMLETLHDNEYILINRLNYRFNDPKRGDVIVFLPPNHRKDYYVKRIIGVPGDTVIIENGKVKIKNKDHPDGFEIQEDYLSEEHIGQTFLPIDIMDKTFTVPENNYFVLGDNRDGSSDSRHWRDALSNEPVPYVDKSMISGKVWLVLWPINAIRQISPYW